MYVEFLCLNFTSEGFYPLLFSTVSCQYWDYLYATYQKIYTQAAQACKIHALFLLKTPSITQFLFMKNMT